MSVLIGGGTGFVGQHVFRKLVEKGYKCTVVSRTRNSAHKHRVTWGDIEKNGLPSDCKAVVNVSGENILNPLKRESDKGYMDQIYESRIGTNKLLVKLIKDAQTKPEVFVTMSGVGYYPPSPTEEYTETGRNGEDWIGKLAKDWEEAGRLPAEIPTRRVIVRSGVVLGNDGGMIYTIRHLLKLSTFQQLGSGKQWFPWIHIDDMAGFITYAVENQHVLGVFNGVAPEAVTNAGFTKALAKSHRLWFTFGFVPEFSVKMMYGEKRAMVVLEGQKVVPKRTLDVGYKFVYPTIDSACNELAFLPPRN